MVSASARGRSNQRKGGYHERKQGKRLGELTGFTFERKLGKRREADHLGDLLCSNARWPFVIRTNIAPKVTASRQGRGSKPAERHLNRVSGPKRHLAKWPHSAALLRSSERYRMRAGWISADPVWHR